MSETVRRVALVTGGTAGIGRAIAGALREDGIAVVVAARRPDMLEAMRAEGYGAIACDVSRRPEIAAMAATLARDYGRLDVLVNNAGLVRRETIERATDAGVDLQIAVNLVGTIDVTRACLGLVAAARGSIINMSSGLAVRPAAATSVYAATKAAVEAFTRTLAVELGPKGVRVNAVQPGLVRTDIYRSAGVNADDLEAYFAKRARELPLGRIGVPEDVASLVRFLASPAASWITGACLRVDGGGVLGA